MATADHSGPISQEFNPDELAISPEQTDEPAAAATVPPADTNELATTPIPDPQQFFDPATQRDAMAAFSKSQALRVSPPTLLDRWLRLAHVESALWALVPILVAATYSWAYQAHVRPTTTLALIVGTLALVLGTNLLRGVAARLKTPTALLGAPESRIGAGLIGLGAIIGLIVTRGIPTALPHTLGLLGLVAAIGYALLPLSPQQIPGEEAIPALAFGPGLFVLTLAVQQPTPLHLSGSAWLIGLGLGCLIGARLIAARFGEHSHAPTATRALLGLSGLRGIYLLLLVAAYGFVLIDGLSRHGPHATIAVLLSLPMAVLPLTGVLRARVAGALNVIAAQSQQLLLWFGGWLVIGFLVSGLYLRLLAALHHIPGLK